MKTGFQMKCLTNQNRISQILIISFGTGTQWTLAGFEFSVALSPSPAALRPWANSRLTGTARVSCSDVGFAAALELRCCLTSKSEESLQWLCTGQPAPRPERQVLGCCWAGLGQWLGIMILLRLQGRGWRCRRRPASGWISVLGLPGPWQPAATVTVIFPLAQFALTRTRSLRPGAGGTGNWAWAWVLLGSWPEWHYGSNLASSGPSRTWTVAAAASAGAGQTRSLATARLQGCHCSAASASEFQVCQIPVLVQLLEGDNFKLLWRPMM